MDAPLGDDWYPDQRAWYERFLSDFFPGICLYAAIAFVIVAFVLWLK